MYSVEDREKYLKYKGIKKRVDKGYLYIDNGIDEIVIKETDLCDLLVVLNEDVNVYNHNGEFILSTFGCFLNKVADMDYRTKIIDRLVALQLENESTNIIEYWETL